MKAINPSPLLRLSFPPTNHPSPHPPLPPLSLPVSPHIIPKLPDPPESWLLFSSPSLDLTLTHLTYASCLSPSLVCILTDLSSRWPIASSTCLLLRCQWLFSFKAMNPHGRLTIKYGEISSLFFIPPTISLWVSTTCYCLWWLVLYSGLEVGRNDVV